jgi:hypothetical protein
MLELFEEHYLIIVITLAYKLSIFNSVQQFVGLFIIDEEVLYEFLLSLLSLALLLHKDNDQLFFVVEEYLRFDGLASKEGQSVVANASCECLQ